MLKSNPMHSYKNPQYPTKIQVYEDPDLLKKYMPPLWQRNAQVAGLATLFMVASCQANKSILKSDLASDEAAIVAPIFEYGDGRGSVGCEVINPPVFLSEEEALQVIGEELTKSGFKLNQTNVSLDNLTIYHGTRVEWSDDYRSRTYHKGDLKPLNVDFYDKDQKVAIEFVSMSDNQDFGIIGNDFSSVQSYNFKSMADSLAEEVKIRGKGVYFGSFYDPVADAIDDDYWHSGLKGDVSKQYLRSQVKDFIDWLKAQGVM